MNLNQRLRRKMDEKGAKAAKKWNKEYEDNKKLYLEQLLSEITEENRHEDLIPDIQGKELI